jgi:GxxExxY protein
MKTLSQGCGRAASDTTGLNLHPIGRKEKYRLPSGLSMVTIAMNNEHIPEHLNRLSGRVVHAAYKVHKALGPGLLESVYEVCLVHELTKSRIFAERQVSLPVVYDELKLEAGFRIDVLVEHRLIVELKAVEGLLPVHQAQVLTYLKLSGHRLGCSLTLTCRCLKKASGV